MRKINLQRDKQSRASIAKGKTWAKVDAPLPIMKDEKAKANQKIKPNQEAKAIGSGKTAGDSEEKKV